MLYCPRVQFVKKQTDLGIGKEVCQQLVTAGAKTLVLWDINKKENDKLAKLLRNMDSSVSVYAYEVDVVNREHVSRTAKQVRQDVGSDVTILLVVA